MYKFNNNQLPAVFDGYFLSTSKVHNYKAPDMLMHSQKQELIMTYSE